MQKYDHFSEKTLIFLQMFKRLKFCLPSARAMEKNRLEPWACSNFGKFLCFLEKFKIRKKNKKKKQLILSEWFLKQKFKAETENSSRHF